MIVPLPLTQFNELRILMVSPALVSGNALVVLGLGILLFAVVWWLVETVAEWGRNLRPSSRRAATSGVAPSTPQYSPTRLPGFGKLITCDRCQVMLRSHNAGRHERRCLRRHRIRHGEMLKCPRCCIPVALATLRSHNIRVHRTNSVRPLAPVPVFCPVCEQRVGCHRMGQHLSRAHPELKRRNSSEHPYGSAFLRSSQPREFVLIDGTDLMLRFGAREPRLDLCLALTLALLRDGRDVLCVFDGTKFKQARSHLQVRWCDIYDRLLKEAPLHFSEAPQAANGIECLLTIADRCNSVIVSGERYDEYANRFPWLKDPQRLTACEIANGQITFGTAACRYDVEPGRLRKQLMREIRNHGQERTRRKSPKKSRRA